MTGQETKANYPGDTRQLKIAGEFEAMLSRQQVFLNRKKNNPTLNVTLPNYLWVSRQGGGISTYVNLLTDHLYETKGIEFCGRVKYIEFTLEYQTGKVPFSILINKFDSTITGSAGYNRYFKGVVCIDINEWVDDLEEDHFLRFVNYVSGNKRILVIFCIHTDERNVIEAVESVLSAQMRIETIILEFPDSKELVDLIESRYLQAKGFSATEGAKILLQKSIDELRKARNFNGFKSISQLGDDILYSIVSDNSSDNKLITADMLSGFSTDSFYVKRARAQIGARKPIGFVDRGM